MRHRSVFRARIQLALASCFVTQKENTRRCFLFVLGSRLVLTVANSLTLISAAGHTSLLVALGFALLITLRCSSLPNWHLSVPSHSQKQNRLLAVCYCAWEQARTADPSSFNRMLYQLSYPSKWWLLYWFFEEFQSFIHHALLRKTASSPGSLASLAGT